MIFQQMVVNLPITGYTGGARDGWYYDKLYEIYLEIRSSESSGSTAAAAPSSLESEMSAAKARRLDLRIQRFLLICRHRLSAPADLFHRGKAPQ